MTTWLAAASGAQAQNRADAFGFTQSTGTYTAQTGGTVLGTISNDDTNFAGSIGFSFSYLGTAYTTLSVSPNGVVRFNSTNTYTGYVALSSSTLAVAALNRDLQGQAGSELSIQTIGTSPNRTCVVQWANYRKFGAAGDSYNFQIRLNETANTIQMVYGPFTSSTTVATPQVGINGAAATDFNNRQGAAGPDLTNTGATLTNTATVSFGVGLLPPSGLTFTYTPSTTVQLPAIRPTASTITASSATVSFVAPTPTAVPTGYTATVTPAVAGSPFTVTASPFTISGLTATTSYKVSIVANYAAGSSLPTETYFQAAANCLAPSALAITNNTTGTSASLSFTNAATGVTNYTVTTSPATSTYTVASAPSGTPLSLTGLSAATTYVVTVRSNCTAGGQSAPVTVSFTTPSQQANFTTARSTGIAYSSIQSTGTSFTWQSTSTDDNVTTTVPLTAGSAAAGATAFAFNYLGLNVQGFQVSINGWLTFNTTNTSTSFSNNLSTTSPNLVLAPFWEDLVIQGNPGAVGLPAAKIKYQVTGTAPNRKLIAEWAEMETFGNAGPNLNFQVVLTETANTIEYRYGNMSGFDGSANYSYTYSLGMNGATASTPNTYLALDVPNSNYFLQNNASTSQSTPPAVPTAVQRGNSLSIAPACNTSLVFTPSASFTANPAPVAVVPANDDPTAATTLALGTGAPTDFCTVYSSANATATAGVLVCSATTPGNADDDVWFKFVVPVLSDVTVTLRSSGAYDGVLQVFYADAAGNIATGAGSALDCKNATAAGLTENSILTALDPGTYYVRVYEAGTGSGYNGTFVLAAYATPAPPANDNCAGALTLNAAGTTCVPTTGTTITATASTGAPACTATTPGNADDDVWYKFTTGSTAVNDYNITLQSGSGFDGVLQLYSGTCSALTALGCINSTGTGGAEAAVTNGLAASTTYYIRVYHAGSGAGSGNFTLCVFRSCNPPGSVTAAAGAPNVTNVTFTNGGSGNFTVTATPTAGPGTATVTGTGTTGATPGVPLTGLVLGTTYSIVVQGDCGATATSTISYTVPVPAPANDNPTGAIALPLTATCTPTNGTNEGATSTTANGYTNPGCAAAFTPIDVWYTFTTTASGAGSTGATITVSGTPAGQVRVFSAATSAGPFTQVGCANGTTNNTQAPALNVAGLAPSTTYYVFVSGYGSGDVKGAFTICATFPPSCSPPTGVAVGAITATTANVTFTGPGIGNTSYTATATPSAGPVVTATGTASPIALTGLAPNTSYSVVLAGNCGAAGTAAAVTFSTLPPPPANDLCSGAIAVACGSFVTGTNAGATTTGEPTATCGTTPSTTSGGVFYSFVGNNRMVTVSTDNPATDFDTKLFVYSGSCGALTCVGGVDDNGVVTFSRSIVRFAAVAGTTYYVVVAGFSGSGNFGLSVDCNDPLNNLTVTGTNGTIAGSYNDVTITGTGTGTLSGPLTVYGDMVVQGILSDGCQTIGGSGTFATQAGSSLSICSASGITASGAAGTVQVSGVRSFSDDANYTYNGTVAQAAGNGLPARTRNLTVNNAAGVTLSAATSVRQLARLQSGNLATGGNAFTLLSQDGYGSAVLDNTGGAVTGLATVQRAVDQTPVATSGRTGYHHYAAPVTNTSLPDLDVTGSFANTYNPAYNTALEPGRTRPFPTVFGYDETRLATSPAVGLDAFSKGWFSPIGTEAMAVGKGYSANIPNALVVDFVGTLNNGAVNITGLSRGADAEAGWHLVGNPYPAPLNWDLVTAPSRANLDAAMYVFNSTGPYSGAYRTRANGIGGSPLITSATGFFVRATSTTTPGVLNLTNAQRVTTFGAQPAFGRGTADSRPTLRLALTNAVGTLADDAFVYCQTGATLAADAQFDAAKLANPSGLNLATVAGTQPLAINGLPLLTTAPVLLPLTVAVPAAGRYAFTAAELRNFGSATVVLRDALTGTRTILTAGTVYPFTAATASANGRFVLELNPAAAPLASAQQALAALVQVYPNPARGAFTLTVPAVAGASKASVTLHNALGQVVATRTVALTAAGATAEFNTTALATGVYSLTLRVGNETATRRVVVE